MHKLMTLVAAASVGAAALMAVTAVHAQAARPQSAQAAVGADDSFSVVHWRGRGAAIGAGIAVGALLGAGIAHSYGPGPYYYGPAYYGPYYGPPVVYAPPPVDGAVAYCMRRYRSYDPGSGTFLGYDGYRHPCP